MNEIVKEFIEEKQKAILSQKNETLFRLGIYEKEYSDTCTGEYNHTEWDKSLNRIRYYKIIPIEVTDEEYKEILKYANTISDTPPKKNSFSQALYIIGIIFYIIGVISVFVGIGFGSLVAALISGTLLLGFSEIINLLQQIRDK